MKLYLIAGEPSGDALGAALMAGLKALQPEVKFVGVGGPMMAAEGLESLFPMSDLSVMGLAEVLPKLRGLFRRRDETVADVLASGADALITIDSPDFCLRVARKVRAASGIPTIHYVAPTVWAWRPKRAEKMALMIDHVLALFPFEPPLMQAAGMSCDFVGHPVVAKPAPAADQIAALRQGDGPLVLVLPGSRRGEVERLAPVFGEAVQNVLAQVHGANFLVVAAPAVGKLVEEVAANWPNTRVLHPTGEAEKFAAFSAADVALAASGTVSLELAAAATPMVIAYKMNWLTFAITKRKFLIDTVTLVNVVTDTRVVPEYLGPDCKAGPIADALTELLSDDAARQAQIDAGALTMERLGKGGEDPGLRAARSVLEFLAKR